MKKTLIIALAGLMLFAFTQCGGNGKEKETKSDQAVEETTTVEEATTLEGTQEFLDNMELFNQIEKSIKDAQTCEELEGAVFGIVGMAMANSQKEYSEQESITEEEKEKLDDLGDELQELIESKMEELGCEEDSDSL